MLYAMTRQEFSKASYLKFHVKNQVSRILMYGIGLVVSLAFRQANYFDFSLVNIFSLVGVSFLSAFLFIHLYRGNYEKKWGIRFYPIWMILDILLISFGIYSGHDPISLWFMLYVVNTAAAAFAKGGRAATAVAAGNMAAYTAVIMIQSSEANLASNLRLGLGQLIMLYGLSFFFIRGIAQLRQKRIQIKRLLVENEDIVKELRAANQHIKDSDQRKSEFLANMSHELRTPLNSVIGFSEIMQRKLADSVEPKYLRFLNNIHSSGEHLLTLINDILDLSKIEAGKMELFSEKFSIQKTIQGVLSIAEGMAQKRKIQVVDETTETIPEVTLDEGKIKQILFNLISNAIKFSPDSSTVSVSVSNLSAEESPLKVASIKVSVADQGMGIKEENQDSVFKEFQRVETGDARGVKGTGLGLTLVQRFSELHGGSVGLDSVFGKGSTFWVVFPVFCKASGNQDDDEVLSADDGSKKTPTSVLVVEDDPGFSAQLQAHLESAGFSVSCAQDGETALKMLNANKPTLITLDINLPGIDGFEVLRQLKADPQLKDLPVLMVSRMDNHELAWALGVDDYISKPLDRSRLLGSISQILGSSSQSQQNLLVVEDGENGNRPLSEKLVAAGYQVNQVSEIKEAVGQGVRGEVHGAIVDLNSNQVSPVDFIKALHQEKATQSIPILAVYDTNLPMASLQEVSKSVSGLIASKSGGPNQLLDEVGTLLAHQKNQPE